jgi:GNAT superfamily N-acetyltransferase
VILHEWDPATASAADVTEAVCIINEVFAADLPADPPWRTETAREYLAVTLPGERRHTWLATDDDGAHLGRATLLTTDDIGVIDLVVRPSARRRGVGSTLLAAVTGRAADEGIEALGVEVADRTPSVRFFEALGFRMACTELRSVLTLSTVDWPKVDRMAEGIGSGYRVEFLPGGPPPELHESYTAAKEATRHLEPPDLDLRPSSYGPERLAESLRTLQARGLKPYVVVAIHERSETVAALTEVVVPAHRPTRADQYDTIVVPAHRGYGADRAIKARMLIELRRAEPGLLDVQTWNAIDNEQILKINGELGFKADREWREYAVTVAELRQRLGTAR